MKSILVLSILLFITCSVSAQKTGPITVKNKFWYGLKCYQNYIELSKNDVRLSLYEHPDLLEKFNNGHNMRIWADMLFGMGGLFILYPTSQAQREVDSDLEFVAIGALSVVIGAIIYRSGKKKIVSAIDVYNQSLASNEIDLWRDKETVQFQLRLNGISLRF